ncbi:MAG TPA: cytidylate kinase-like family protein [Chloroflexota bacterium]|nr:cytidylate kinase-like family protein [Chloroflexota bacterium]
MPLVTLSRQLGSWGDEIGQDVAQALGVSYVDREIIKDVAQRMDAPEQAVSDIEEKSPTLAKRVANAIIQAFADGTRLAPLVGVVPAPVLPPPEEQELESSPPVFTFDINDTLYLNFVRQVVREVAAGGNAVIVGRATHLLLRDMPRALHVHVVAPWDVRVQRIAQDRGCSREAAEKSARDSDHARESYTSRFYQSRWSDPSLYHLTVNTGLLSRQQAADLIVEAARRIQ